MGGGLRFPMRTKGCVVMLLLISVRSAAAHCGRLHLLPPPPPSSLLPHLPDLFPARSARLQGVEGGWVWERGGVLHWKAAEYQDFLSSVFIGREQQRSPPADSR